jgi:hypothetical protein
VRRFLLVLALVFPPLLTTPTVAHADRVRCWPTLTFRPNGTIVVRFKGTIGECLPVWGEWAAGIPVTPPLDRQFVVTSASYNRARDVTTIKGHLAA